jgi:hypothetical protein
MPWTAPAYDEIKMDAEIGSYQQDPEPRDPFARPAAGGDDDNRPTAEG